MQANIWLKKKITLFIGGDPAKGQAPVMTIELGDPQILVDPEKGTLVILETSQGQVIKK